MRPDEVVAPSPYKGLNQLLFAAIEVLVSRAAAANDLAVGKFPRKGRNRRGLCEGIIVKEQNVLGVGRQQRGLDGFYYIGSGQRSGGIGVGGWEEGLIVIEDVEVDRNCSRGGLRGDAIIDILLEVNRESEGAIEPISQYWGSRRVGVVLVGYAAKGKRALS